MIPMAFPPLPQGGNFDIARATQSQSAPAARSFSLEESKPSADAKADAKVREAALQFEGIMVRQLLQPLEKSLAGGMGGEGGASPMVGGMIVNSLSQSIIDGGGLGLADIIEESLRGAVVGKVSPTTGTESPPMDSSGGGETD